MCQVEEQMATAKAKVSMAKKDVAALHEQHDMATRAERSVVTGARRSRTVATRDRELLSHLAAYLTQSQSLVAKERLQQLSSVLSVEAEQLGSIEEEVKHLERLVRGAQDPSAPGAARKHVAFLEKLLTENACKAATRLELLKLLQSCAGTTLRAENQSALLSCFKRCRTLREVAPRLPARPAKPAGASTVAFCPIQCDSHAVPVGHPETPARTAALRQALQQLGAQCGGSLELRYQAGAVAASTVKLVHAEGYVDSVLRALKPSSGSRTWRHLLGNE